MQFNHDWAETSPGDRARWARTEMAVNMLAPTLLTALLLDDLRHLGVARFVHALSRVAPALATAIPKGS